MTLILSVVTERAVLQASDRRLVWVEADGSLRMRDDDRNKAVLLGKRLCFAYTGFAEIGPRRQSTDDWLAWTLYENLSGGDQADLLDSLAAATTARLNHRLYARLPAARRGHEFAACGWARFPGSNFKEFRPYLSWISNLRQKDRSLLPEPAKDCGMGFFVLPASADWDLMVSGQQLYPEHEDSLKSMIAATYGDLKQLGSVLIEHIRMAATRNDAVGKGVLLTVIPRGSIRAGDTDSLLIMGGPMENIPTCFSVPADKKELRRYGPTVVSPSGGIISGFSGGPISDP